MGIGRFEKNARIFIDGKEYRLDRQIDGVEWQLEDTRTGRYIHLPHDQLLDKVVDKSLAFPGSPEIAWCGPANANVREEKDEAAKVRCVYVKAALRVPNTKSALQVVISDVWKNLKRPAKPPGWVSVYTWKSRYLKAGEDYRVLVDNDQRKGNRTERYVSTVVAFCKQAIESKYLTRERHSIQETLEDAMIRIKRHNMSLPPDCGLPFPTWRLIKRLIDQVPAFDKLAARAGREYARKTYRSVRGNRTTQAPLQRAEIDHTKLDLFVVDDRTSLPLGRPWVTACIDDFTRCILGIYIGFSPPSYETVAECLKDCFLPKVRLKEEFPQIKSDWPSYGVMSELVLDNGREFHSKSLEQVCFSLGIEMHYSPRHEPWFKGKIERFFGTFNRAVAHGKPGTTFSNIFEKGDYDPTQHAVITLATLKCIARMWIADVYHQELHRSLEMTPAKMWNSSIKPEDINFPDDASQLQVIMGRSERRVLTHKGIEFEGLFYNSPELADLRRQYGKKCEVEIRVDVSDIGSIHVLSPRTTKVYDVPALEREYATGISLWQHTVFKRAQKKDPSLGQDIDGLLEAKERVAEMVERELSFTRKRRRNGSARHRERFEQASFQKEKREAATAGIDASIRTWAGDPPEEGKVCDLLESDKPILSNLQSVGVNTPRFPVEFKEGYKNE